MTLGRNIVSGMRWFERHVLVELVAVATGVILFAGEVTVLSGKTALVALLVAGLLIHRLVLIHDRLSPHKAVKGSEAEEYCQLELLVLCAIYLLIQFTGALISPFYAVLYLMIAVTGALEAKFRHTFVLILVAIVFEGCIFLATKDAFMWRVMVHIGAIIAFSVMTLVVHRVYTEFLRREQKHRLTQERERFEREAYEYRLSGSRIRDIGSQKEDEREERIQRSSLCELDIVIQNLLEMLHSSLRPHTIAIFLLSHDDKHVTLKDARSMCDYLIRDPIPAGEGIIGAILKSEHGVCMEHVHAHLGAFNYYAKKVEVKTFVGIPILEQSLSTRALYYKRGILLADRVTNVPFGDDDKTVLHAAAREIVSIIKRERVIIDLDKIKSESKRFYEASNNLRQALTVEEVVRSVLKSVRTIYAGTDFAAAVLRSSEQTLVLAGVDAEAQFDSWKKKYEHKEIQGHDHLCALTMQKATVLPAIPYEDWIREHRHVFGKSMSLKWITSLKVFPFNVAAQKNSHNKEGKVIGTLVVGGTSSDLFPCFSPQKTEERVEMLQTMANIAAISIQNAQRYQQLERMATTDGLTGLHNHRRFQEMMDQAVTFSIRYKRPLSMLFTDIDHFKLVNDQYGHPVGDRVLKTAARVLNEQARESDKVCRYGGEEFAVILPETNVKGACDVAERIRKEIKRCEFNEDKKSFRVTLSLGVCTMPQFAHNKRELIDRADQALYYAKNNGRDCTFHFAQITHGL